jgi:hypothetical protein
MFGSVNKYTSCLIGVAGFAILLAACGGGGSSDAQQIRQLYPAAMSAVSHHQWSELCSDTTEECTATRATARVVDSYHGQSFVDHQYFVRQGGRWLLNRAPSG